MSVSVKRSSIAGIKDLGGTAKGVGGRHEAAPSATGGGGYQDICTTTEHDLTRARAADPRLDELREFGLPKRWLDIADIIGVDSLMEVWRILDQDNLGAGLERREMVRIYIPQLTSFFRFQRNRYIKALVDRGETAESIRRYIKEVLCEDMSRRHIFRIISKCKMKP